MKNVFYFIVQIAQNFGKILVLFCATFPTKKMWIAIQKLKLGSQRSFASRAFYDFLHNFLKRYGVLFRDFLKKILRIEFVLVQNSTKSFFRFQIRPKVFFETKSRLKIFMGLSPLTTLSFPSLI